MEEVQARLCYEESRTVPMPKGTAEILVDVRCYHLHDLACAIVRVTLTSRNGSEHRCSEVHEVMDGKAVLTEDKLLTVASSAEAIRCAILGFDRRCAELTQQIVRAYDNAVTKPGGR